MRKPQSVAKLEDFGRVRLSKSFFMRDFLYSEISQIEKVPNIPDDPDLAIQNGKRLCEDVLEPIQATFGRISIRSAFRSAEVNKIGSEKNLGCASNEANFAAHIWDRRDKNGHCGAMACIVVNADLPYFEHTGDWQALAWWIHDHVPGYSSMEFFARGGLLSFNIGWHEHPTKRITSWIGSERLLTKPGMENFHGSHADKHRALLDYTHS